MKKRIAGVIAACVMLSMTVPNTALAAGFVQDTAGVKYQNDDGSFAVNTWVQVLDKIYHLDGNGYVQFGWIQVGELWYFLDAAGVCTNPWGQSTPPTGQTQTNSHHSLTADEIKDLAPYIHRDDLNDLIINHELEEINERYPIDFSKIECTPVYSDSISSNTNFDGMHG